MMDSGREPPSFFRLLLRNALREWREQPIRTSSVLAGAIVAAWKFASGYCPQSVFQVVILTLAFPTTLVAVQILQLWKSTILPVVSSVVLTTAMLITVIAINRLPASPPYPYDDGYTWDIRMERHRTVLPDYVGQWIELPTVPRGEKLPPVLITAAREKALQERDARAAMRIYAVVVALGIIILGGITFLRGREELVTQNKGLVILGLTLTSIGVGTLAFTMIGLK